MIVNLVFKLTSYISFLYKSKNHHSIHSPFVYNLVTKCIYDNKPKENYDILKKYRQSLIQNKKLIHVTDFGAGSKVFKTNKRKISSIAKTAGISKKRAELLYRITQYFKPKSILEIGSSLGLATFAMAIGNKNANVTGLEGCPETAKHSQLQLEQFDLENITILTTEFSDYLSSTEIQSSPEKFDLIYFDGNHTKFATLKFFELLLTTITNDSIFIFDDIYWSSEMAQAWNIIKKYPKVTVTIDTFQWGIVFFRTEQAKEDFVIRI